MRVHARVHSNLLQYAWFLPLGAHRAHTVATFKQLPSGNWRVQIRRKGSYLGNTFRRRRDGEEWALDAEGKIDRGETPLVQSMGNPETFGYLIDLHLRDMIEVGKPPRRTKSFSMDALNKRLGKVRLSNLTRERLIEFGKDRWQHGAGAVTIAMDMSYIKTVVTHAAAVHGLNVSPQAVDLARVALKRLGMIAKSRDRDRRPTAQEIERILQFLEQNPRQFIPVGRIVRFAIATGMRQDEICRICWSDVDELTRTISVRDRKDPRHKSGNQQKVPLLDLTGVDAWAILEEQRPLSHGKGRIFPFNPQSVGTAFRRACKALKIGDLHFHDLRHEATSRLFEAGLSIEQVALVTGHRDWKMLKRYTNLRPEDLHRLTAKGSVVRRSTAANATEATKRAAA